jgi:hypothetical protein
MNTTRLIRNWEITKFTICIQSQISRFIIDIKFVNGYAKQPTNQGWIFLQLTSSLHICKMNIKWHVAKVLQQTKK